jgi:acetyl-CoA acetyltransferase
MKDQVAVVGIGCTKFGERYERTYEELICDAAFAAYDDAGIDPDEIQAAYLGTYMPGPGGGKSATSLGDALRLYGRPITRVENYCATGTDAFRNACLAIASGVYDVVLVLGAEKLKDRGGRIYLQGTDCAEGDIDVDKPLRLTFRRLHEAAACRASATRCSRAATPRRASSRWPRTATCTRSASARRRSRRLP